MKRFIICLTLILCLLLCACSSGESSETTVLPSSEAEAVTYESAEPTEKPTETARPTEAASEAEETTETEAHTEKPSEKPTEAPTEKPAEKPAAKPTEKPTAAPTEEPTEPTEATVPPTEPAPVLEENEAYLPYKTEQNSLAVIVNTPFTEDLSATEVWFEGEIDAAYIIPRYVGSKIALYRINWEVEGNSTYSLERSAEACNGCIIYGALFRPEGMPMWYVEITAPDGRSEGLTLYYNGDTGTPHLEYIGGTPIAPED